MHRLVLSCLAALFAVLGLSVASSGAGPEAQRVLAVGASVVETEPGTDVDHLGTAADALTGENEREREPVFLGVMALTAVAAGVGASARLHVAARRRTG